MTFLRKFLRRSLPVLILFLGIALAYLVFVTKPQAEQREPPVPILKVEAVRLVPGEYTVIVDSQGIVSARTESTLIPEVSGRIIKVAANFREGGFFKEGDVLLEIDPSDYLAAVTIAEANLAEAKLRLAEEQEASYQAKRDWQRLGIGESPSELVLREPQLALAQAAVAAEEARVDQAKRNLERTRISAPFQGRVLDLRVDVGQVVSPGTVLAEVYAVDYAEIRLPLTTEEYAFLDLPPLGRGGSNEEVDIPVTLETQFGPEKVTWTGKVVRVEGAVDTRSRQIYVVAQVDDPYGNLHLRPLKVGLFVEASIQGKILQEVYVLPRTALREGRFVLTIDDNNQILRVPVNPIWSTADEVVFKSDSISPGTLASLTQMALAIDGMVVDPVVEGASGPPRGSRREAVQGADSGTTRGQSGEGKP